MSQGSRPYGGDPWINLDGRLNASGGTAQFPNLLQAYPTATAPNARRLWPSMITAQPPWRAAGVDYAIGLQSNCTVNTSTSIITETGPQSTHANGNKLAFYTIGGGSLPTGITQGTLYFVINVSGSTYQISTTSGGSAITLGGSPSGVIVLKDPLTCTLPTGCNKDTTAMLIEPTANNLTLDSWDLSQEQGWTLLPNANLSGLTVNNCFSKVGTNCLTQVWFQNGNLANSTFTYCEFDANGSGIVSLNTSASSAAGSQTLIFTSTNGVFVNQLVNDITNQNAIPNENNAATTTFVSAVTPTTVTITRAINTGQTVGSGDTIVFGTCTGGGMATSGGGTQAANPFATAAITLGDTGTMTFKYCWFRNAFTEQWQTGAGAGSYVFQYNLWENSGWGGPLFGQHGDIIQHYGGGGTFEAFTFSFNTVIQNNSGAASLALSIMDSGTFGASAVGPFTINNNTWVLTITPANVSNGILATNNTWLQGSGFLQQNYVDPTGCEFAWFALNAGGGTGPYPGGNPGNYSIIGNVNMLNGVPQGGTHGLPNDGSLPT